jgi:hypothetical protein
MTEEQIALEKAIGKFFKVFSDDVYGNLAAGVLPVAYILVFRELTKYEFETLRYSARCTIDCPPGLEKALEDVLGKWIEETYGELLPADQLPSFKQ